MTDEDYSYYDHIFVMDWANLRDMKQRFGDYEGKIRMLMSLAGQEEREIPDPWYTGDFESTYRDICTALNKFLGDSF